MQIAEENELFENYLRYAVYLLHGLDKLSPAAKEALRIRRRLAVRGEISQKQFINFMEGLDEK